MSKVIGGTLPRPLILPYNVNFGQIGFLLFYDKLGLNLFTQLDRIEKSQFFFDL